MSLEKVTYTYQVDHASIRLPSTHHSPLTSRFGALTVAHCNLTILYNSTYIPRLMGSTVHGHFAELPWMAVLITITDFINRQGRAWGKEFRR